jgi:hypothetical protein
MQGDYPERTMVLACAQARARSAIPRLTLGRVTRLHAEGVTLRGAARSRHGEL